MQCELSHVPPGVGRVPHAVCTSCAPPNAVCTPRAHPVPCPHAVPRLLQVDGSPEEFVFMLFKDLEKYDVAEGTKVPSVPSDALPTNETYGASDVCECVPRPALADWLTRVAAPSQPPRCAGSV